MNQLEKTDKILKDVKFSLKQLQLDIKDLRDNDFVLDHDALQFLLTLEVALNGIETKGEVIFP